VEPIIFLIQRSLLSVVFIPHEVFTTQKYVHSSTLGSAEGGYPLCGVQGAYPLGWGVWGKRQPSFMLEIMLGFFSLEGNPFL
jgi:hypothetical protein